MRKSIIASILLICFIFTGCGFYRAVTDDGNRFYKDISRNIEYEYDYNWAIQDANQNNSYFSIVPNDTTLKASIFVSISYSLDENTTTEALFEELKNKLSADSDNASIQSELSGTNASGYNYYEIIYTSLDENDNLILCRDRFTQIGLMTVYSSGASYESIYDDSLRESYDIFFNSITNYK